MTMKTAGGGDTPVDVIVPVYRDLALTRRCLESVLAAPVKTPYQLLVIDDATPEPDLAAWLDELAQRHAGDGRLVLLRNRFRLGFVRTVNRGMAQHPERDLVLLNSDTEVHGDWLDRLRACADAEPDTGTVTPLTNNGTLASYPRFMADNPLPADWDLARLDDLAARVNAGRQVEIPTAVGFCMYIRRPCLEACGFFDAMAYGRGYGEENDFSARARDLGFRNLLCGDVFVRHAGGKSFGDEASALQARATRVLEQRHPDYRSTVAAHVRADPARALRARLDLARLVASPRPRILFLSHAQGGGVARHCRDLAALLADDLEVLQLSPAAGDWLCLEWLRPGEALRLYYREPEEHESLLADLRRLEVRRVHVHHVMGLPQRLLRLGEELGLPQDFTAHDYYAICPQYNLTDEQGEYCGEPDENGCARCLAARHAPWGLDIQAWRAFFARLLTDAERVFVPSEDVRRRLARYVPEASLVLAPHPEANPAPCHIPPQTEGDITALVLGVINPAKGVQLLGRCAWDARERDLPLRFRVLGWSETPIPGLEDLPIEFTGPYEPDALPALLEASGGDVFFFPTRAPETYSFTLSEALACELPILAPRRGALAERLASVPRATLLEPDTEAAGWNDRLLAAGRAHRDGEAAP